MQPAKLAAGWAEPVARGREKCAWRRGLVATGGGGAQWGGICCYGQQKYAPRGGT